ncbi:MAG: hypothetical protein ACO3VH_01375, partial [Ilumatobacteraceae bacterium]
VHVGPGLPSFTMLGLPDESCREARDRVRAAVLSITPPVRVASPRRRPSSPLAQVLLDACRNGPRALDQLVSGSGAGVAPVALAVAELVRDGWLVDEAGWLEVAVSGLPP